MQHYYDHENLMIFAENIIVCIWFALREEMAIRAKKRSAEFAPDKFTEKIDVIYPIKNNQWTN